MARFRARSKKDDLPAIAPRARFVFVPLAILFTLLIGRAFQLQFMEHPELERFMKRVEPTDMEISQRNRGIIFDRKGRELAVNVLMDSVYIDPLIFKEQSGYLASLKTIAKVTQTQYSKLKSRLGKSSRFFWVKRQANPAVVQKIKDMQLKGVHFIKESKRFYPNGPLAAHVLGFTNIDSKGLEGLEYSLDRQLKGEESSIRAQRDAKGRTLFVGGITKKGRPGHNVFLTLDTVIQYAAERELEELMRETQAKAASIIAINPHDGSLLALANEPTFNPNRYRDGNRSVWRNRAITDAFEPGSTFKPFVVSHALERGVIESNQTLYCKKGSLSVQRKIINEPEHEDWLTPQQILKVSSNIGAAKIGLLMGSNNMRTLMNRFGFGVETGVPLPGESPGLIQPPSHWSEYDLASSGFGQGFAVTAMQLARGFSALVNGGFVLKPRLVLRTEDPSAGVETHTKEEPVVVGKAIRDDTSALIKSMLETVVSKDGTGHNAMLTGYRIGGKTGTAQRFDVESGTYPAESYVVSFAGFFPFENPEVVLLIVVDRPQVKYASGGKIAAPVFKRLAQQITEYLQLKPDAIANPSEAALIASSELPAVSPRHQKPARDRNVKAGFGRHILGLTIREVLSKAASEGIQVEVEGSGFATGRVDERGESFVIFFDPHLHRNGQVL